MTTAEETIIALEFVKYTEITASDAIEVLRTRGFVQTEESVKKQVNYVGVDAGGKISFLKLCDLAKSIPNDLTREEKSRWDHFRSLDKDGSGYVTVAEVREFQKLEGFDITDEQAAQYVKPADTDDNKKVDFAEFYKFSTGKDRKMTAEEIAFIALEFVKYTEITASDAIKVLYTLGYVQSEESLKKKINDVGVDAGGKISFLKLCGLAESIPKLTGKDKFHWDYFRSLDKDGSGYVTVGEIREFQKDKGNDITEEQAAQSIVPADTDDNKEVDFAEYYKFATGMPLKEDILSLLG